MKFEYKVDKTKFQVECTSNDKFLIINVNGKDYKVVLDSYRRGIRTVLVDDRRIKFGWKREHTSYKIVIDGIEYEVDFPKEREGGFFKETIETSKREEVNIYAPIPGLVVDVRKEEGQRVKKGECVIVLSAMKLENEIMSPKDGVVKSVCVKRGETVSKNTIIAVIC